MVVRKKSLASQVDKLLGLNVTIGVRDEAKRKPKLKSAGLKSFAGGSARKQGSTSGGSVAQLAKDLEKRYGIFSKPIENPSKDLQEVAELMIDQDLNGENNTQEIINLSKAVVRNPILLGIYGMNSSGTAKAKGFNKLLIDTGQTFNAIDAEVK